jgi:D-alanyl-lipoteichoic acid acyltransferase DltB (MBOAT superfamily)
LLLSTSTYFVFLVGIFFLYWSVSRVRALALSVLLFANYFFYARWNLWYLAIIPLASTCDYFIGLGLQATPNRVLRRILVTLSIALNIGLIAFARNWKLSITLSFYAFQALTYTIDLYRRDIKATQSYLAHLAAVSFFPTILAGPITRVSVLVEQFEKRKPLDAADGGRALFLIGLGLIKKLMIADYLAGNLVNRVFDFPNLYTGAENLIAVYSYTLQLYYDFSGYTDIAIGSALLLGIKLPANFNAPYAAHNIADFWRRWHITLSNWLRDYLYFSLPGLRSKWKIFTYTNLLITMVLEFRDLGGAARDRAGNRPAMADAYGDETRGGLLANREHCAHGPLRRVRLDLFSRAEPGDGDIHPGAHRLANRFLRERLDRIVGDPGNRHRGALFAQEVVRR